MHRTIETDLGQGIPGETLTITIHGAPCRLELAQKAVQAALVDVKRQIRGSEPSKRQKPCGGCPDAS